MSYRESLPSRATDAGPDSYSVLDRDEDGLPCPPVACDDELVHCDDCGAVADEDKLTDFPRWGEYRVCPACAPACAEQNLEEAAEQWPHDRQVQFAWRMMRARQAQQRREREGKVA
jgi:hypothetical protein